MFVFGGLAHDDLSIRNGGWETGGFNAIQMGTARQLFRSGAASILPPYRISSSVASRTSWISSLKITSRPHSGLLPSIVTVLVSTRVFCFFLVWLLSFFFWLVV